MAFFAWSAALGKILTMENLRKMHIILVDKCCMCKRNRESVDHLLLYCDTAYALWSTLFTRLIRLGLCIGESLTCLLIGGHLEG